jgi:xylan 1,4-beta-xylosidase
VGWNQIGNALERPSQLALPVTTPSSGGIYAPTLRHHGGRFWLITSDVQRGTVLFTATDPAEALVRANPGPGGHGYRPGPAATTAATDASGRPGESA